VSVSTNNIVHIGQVVVVEYIFKCRVNLSVFHR